MNKKYVFLGCLTVFFTVTTNLAIPRVQENWAWMNECEAQMAQTGRGYCTIELPQ